KYLRIIYILVVAVLLSSCYAVRAYKFRKFELKDLDKFRVHQVRKSNAPFSFFYAHRTNVVLDAYLDTSLENSGTYGFLVIKNDSILYERYFNGLNAENVFPSFSVAKSFVGTLAQVALQEGYIGSFDDPVTQYLPWLSKSDKAWSHITVQQVLDMRTGVKSDETYNSPFSDVIKFGFTGNMKARLKKIKTEPGAGNFSYKSVNTQILGAIIEAATKKPLPVYLQEKLWGPLGMESDATWQTDAKGVARAFCCLNATLRDFARLGRLYLNKGNWNGNQILSEKWVRTILNSDTMLAYQGYKNHWWSSRVIRRFNDSVQAADFAASQNGNWYIGKGSRNGNTFYSAYNNLPAVFAQGMLGQFVYIHPQKNLIIVRMGHGWKRSGSYAQRFIENLAEMIE
ncbi:MAG TPA: serine hydrolase, partial [Niabella sp.]|nr:serine hydrolase [Niabella sp.]